MADLTDLATVKGFLGMTEANPARDEQLEGIISRVSEWFEGQIGRHVIEDEYSRTFDGSGGSRLMLPEYPITEVTLLSVDGKEIDERASVGAGGWVLPDGGQLGEVALEGSVFSEGVQNVEVEWTAGYEDVPGDIERAVIQMVALDFKEGPRIGIQTESSFGTSVSYLPSVVPQAVRDVISRYRSPL